MASRLRKGANRLRKGLTWIAIGMLWIGLAQFGTNMPIATAVALIGFGAIQLAGQRKEGLDLRPPPQEAVVTLMNLLIYVALVGLTIAAQWDLALRSSSRQLGPLWMVDHLLAFAILFLLTWRTASNLLVGKNC